MINDKYGLWLVGGQKFDDKHQALVYATRTNQDVRFWYHDEVFKSVDTNLLGKISLDVLYKERALQLRDQYDYLILYYSGGSDSHNILKTFVDNDIKLDEVCVKWPKPLTEGKFYTANSTDTSAKNVWSEWDLCVVPVLEWLKSNRPNIKISVIDWTENITAVNTTKFLEQNTNQLYGIGNFKSFAFSKSEREQIDNGKSVCGIYGIDKPLLVEKDNMAFTFFSDYALIGAPRNIENPNGSECFYWTKDFPLLALAQAYTMFTWFNVNRDKRKYLYNNQATTRECSSFQNKVVRPIIYNSTWDNRFQADKKTSNIGLDMYDWFVQSDELQSVNQSYMDNLYHFTSDIDKRFLKTNDILGNKYFSVPNAITTPWIYLGNFN